MAVLFLKGLFLSFTLVGCESLSNSSYSDPHAGMTLEQVYDKARAEAGYPPMRPDPIGTVQSYKASSSDRTGTSGVQALQISPITSQSRRVGATSAWREITPGLDYRITRTSSDHDYNELIGQYVVSSPQHHMYRYRVEFKNETDRKYDLQMELMQPNPNNYDNIKLSFLYILQIDPRSSNSRSLGDYRDDL